MSKFESMGCIGDCVTMKYHMPTCTNCHSGIHLKEFLSEKDAIAEGFEPAMCCVESFMQRNDKYIYAGDMITKEYHKYTCPNCHTGLHRHEFLSVDEETKAKFKPSRCCF